ncbi:efflux pump antibiotic resistance protein [Aspergillus avenaceus]|uniref:Efflux pump antibiotic resistance protein n=1 Tax=Aspergillus avenaceus TaxID=36643 RepID=A0A5N6U8Q5_ASPAV|nr:efflux pump antibiotic resistance protein [Aspergillus avenaceus]
MLVPPSAPLYLYACRIDGLAWTCRTYCRTHEELLRIVCKCLDYKLRFCPLLVYVSSSIVNIRIMAKEDIESSSDSEEHFLVEWSDDDPCNPRNMSLVRRWLIVIIVSMGSLCVTYTSSVFTTTYGQMTKEFNCSTLVATLGVSVFVWGLAVGPLVLGPLSELYGRRIIYMTSFTLFVIWIIPCAVATNIQTMIVARFFNGIAGSAFLSVAGGTVGDVFHRQDLAAPMMFYTASPFMGPELGPLIGGFINEFSHWRWTFYVLIIWTGVILILLIAFVPETFHPVLHERKVLAMRKETGDNRWHTKAQRANQPLSQLLLQSIYRPLMLLAREPMCLNLCIFSALVLGIIYLFFGAFDLVFGNVYGMSLWQCGCCFLGMLVGMMIAVATDPIWRRVYKHLEKQHRERGDSTEKFLPEWRLPPAVAGAPAVTVGLFIFAWTIYPDVHWIAPIIGSSLFGFGTVLIFSGIFTFLVEAYPTYAASALAANSFTRCMLGGAFPLFGVQMYNHLGYHWATTLLAFLTLLMAPFPYIFFRYGPRIRQKSRFAKHSSGY